MALYGGSDPDGVELNGVAFAGPDPFAAAPAGEIRSGTVVGAPLDAFGGITDGTGAGVEPIGAVAGPVAVVPVWGICA